MGNEGVIVSGKTTAKIATFPPRYSDYAKLRLFFKSAKNLSVDHSGALKHKLIANAPLNYVKDLQADLNQLGYLPQNSSEGVYSGTTARAVKRFQRHAKRVYRMPGADVKPAETFQGPSTGECDAATAQEIKKWLSKGWKLPLGRFPLTEVQVTGVAKGRLRSDAAAEWLEIVKLVHAAGGVLTGPYGDTQRSLSRAIAAGSAGASGFSFHYCGRAVDINQGFAGGKGMRYFLQQEPSGKRTLWRIYCKVDNQDGSQGTKFAKGQVKCFLPYNESLYDVPEGYYIDMTALIESRGTFERIPAQAGFDDQSKTKKVRQQKLEWWHFQYRVDKQETFLDEVELIGFTEANARAGGWKTDAELDRHPG